MSDKRLELKLGFDAVRAMVSDHCSTEYAAGRVEAEEFSANPSEIRRRLLLTDEMRLILMFEDAFPTSGYIDCLPFLEPIEKGAGIDLLSLGKLRTLLLTLHKVTTFFRNSKEGIYPNLQQLASRVKNFPEILRKIDTILDRHGEIKDTASDELYEIRRSLREKELSVSKTMNAILRKAQQEGIVDADAAVSIRDGKMLIPVSSAKKRQLPGFVHDESASGKTTFIEPAEIVAMTNEIAGLRFAESREIARILHAFADYLRPEVPFLMDAASFVGEVDFIMAKAQTALDMIAGMPIFSDDGTLSLRKARHPLLEKALRKEGRPIVPLTATLTSGKHILLISGPNAGGKSVCLKTVGLLQYMFQWGLLIPTSETSEFPVFERIMVSIGDDQSIDNDLSTYSSFLSDMKEMLAVADDKTLVLIDEFGSGTEPAAGGAIAEAILHELDERGVYGVITTHYTNLKLYASAAECGVVNGAMQFDSAKIVPLFTLEMGLPGNSFAFELARKMGLSEEIVHDAEQRAGEEFVGIERNLRKIARSRRAMEDRLSRIKATDKTLEQLSDKYEKELEEIKEMRRRIIEEAQKEAQEIIRRANREVEATIKTIKESRADKEATREARGGLQDVLEALADRGKTRDKYIEGRLKVVKERKEREKARKVKRGEVSPEEEARAAEQARLEAFRSAPLKVGEKVRVKDNGMVGEVSVVSAKAVTVIIGNITSKMPLDRVERITSNEFKAASKPSSRPLKVYDSALAERKARFKMELDVRGQRVNEAIEEVMRYIDDAIMLNVSSVRILHGKGTGALREEIQKYVRTVPGVASVADEHIQFGGSGVTVVKFE